MDLKKIAIDNRTLGKEMLLVDVRPNYAYMNGQRGDLNGYAYDVCLPAHSLDKLTIKIDGEQQIEAPEEGYVPVEVSGLIVRPYVNRENKLAFTAIAAAIKVAARK